MKTIFHPANERGYANHGWLKSYHSFSFAGFHDPEKMGFGLLRVLNDDSVAGGEGFGAHPHQNMEIISIPLEGALHHQDSTGRDKVIKAGEVQIMSAGKGITHAEFNNSENEEVKFLQIWIFPKENGIEPRYDQKEFSKESFENKFRKVVASDETDGALYIHQNAVAYLGNFTAATELNFTPEFKGNGVYFFMIEGDAEIAGKKLNRRDAIGIYDFDSVQIKPENGAYILALEVPMRRNAI